MAFDEFKINELMRNKTIKDMVLKFRPKYDDKLSEFKKLTDNDFLGLIILTPCIGVALSNKKINVFENLHLTWKARKASEGGVLQFNDPVVEATELLWKNFDLWGDDFFKTLKDIINAAEYKSDIDVIGEMVDLANVEKDGRKKTKTMAPVFYKEIKKIAKRLEINELKSYKQFLGDYAHLENEQA